MIMSQVELLSSKRLQRQLFIPQMSSLHSRCAEVLSPSCYYSMNGSKFLLQLIIGIKITVFKIFFVYAVEQVKILTAFFG